jgi:hypothetical protein
MQIETQANETPAGWRRPESAPTPRAADRTGHTNYALIRLLSEEGLRLLANEARSGLCAARPWGKAVPATDDQENVAESWMEGANAGPLLLKFIAAPEMLDSLYRLTGQRWRPRRRTAWAYAYHRARGHNLGLHRDHPSCELAVITCIDDQPGEGGDLLLYPQRVTEPLSAIRATPDQGCVRLRLRPGDTAVMFGNEIPHRVTPMLGEGRTRITAAVCYERIEGA